MKIYQKIIMSKYQRYALEVLDKYKWKSTNSMKKELEKIHKKSINWHILFIALEILEKQNKIERIELVRTIAWRRK